MKLELVKSSTGELGLVIPAEWDPTKLSKLCGHNANAWLMYIHLVELLLKQSKSSTWIPCTYKEWKETHHLGKVAVDNAVAKLKEGGLVLVEVRLDPVSNRFKTHYQLTKPLRIW